MRFALAGGASGLATVSPVGYNRGWVNKPCSASTRILRSVSRLSFRRVWLMLVGATCRSIASHTCRARSGALRQAAAVTPVSRRSITSVHAAARTRLGGGPRRPDRTDDHPACGRHTVEDLPPLGGIYRSSCAGSVLLLRLEG